MTKEAVGKSTTTIVNISSDNDKAITLRERVVTLRHISSD